jgi:hypothetical protein
MARFRKKPEVIEAIQFSRNNWDEVRAFTNNAVDDLTIDIRNHGHVSCCLYVDGGFSVLVEGEWIIKDELGGLKPCSADVFAQTYELVEEGT